MYEIHYTGTHGTAFNLLVVTSGLKYRVVASGVSWILFVKSLNYLFTSP